MDFKKELKSRIETIEEEISLYMPKEEGYQKTIFEAMNYSLRAGGKRLRPILLKEAYLVCRGEGREYAPYSAALEMLHTYSLIHDDLPALDNDDLRRGKPTNHKVFGEAMAILAGDALYSYAFEIMLKAGVEAEDKKSAMLASYDIAKGAGIYGMVGGQVVDVESEDKKISKDTMDFIHANKTGALIVASTTAGANLARASEKEVEALRNYGKKIGLAFQIVDDILDIVGDEEELGKHVGSDIENAKSTYPSLFGLERSREMAEELVEEAKNELKIFPKEKREFLEALAEYIIERKK